MQTNSSFLSDDDDDDDEESEKISKGGEDEREGSAEGGEKIKPDPEAPPKEPAQKLHEYTPDELSRYKKQELLGDVELLDGRYQLISGR